MSIFKLFDVYLGMNQVISRAEIEQDNWADDLSYIVTEDVICLLCCIVCCSRAPE